MSVLPVCRNVHILLGALACLACVTARATSVRPPQFGELVARADLVVRAETVAARCEWRGQGPTRRIVTLVTVRVLERVVGPAPATLELELLGGTVGGETLTVTDQPVFEAGARDILFVAGNGRRFCPLVGMGYGRYPIVPDPADARRELVTRENGEPLRAVGDVARPLSRTAVDSTQTQPAAAGPISVAEFTAQIRRTAAQLGRRDVAP